MVILIVIAIIESSFYYYVLIIHVFSRVRIFRFFADAALMGAQSFENATPVLYSIKPRERPSSDKDMDESVEDPIDTWEIFDLIRDINDPEHPYTLEQLNVVQEELIKVHINPKETFFCSIFLKLYHYLIYSNLLSRYVFLTPIILMCKPYVKFYKSSSKSYEFKKCVVILGKPCRLEFQIRVAITEGSHNTEEAINRQLSDKERVAAAMENPGLMHAVNQCLTLPE
uniref:FLYWCH-type domain-containing protein n=1 Tax=Heterorhabditis bacteriophora TaxID=37862 RepID=A0A1I7WGD5_HETBA